MDGGGSARRLDTLCFSNPTIESCVIDLVYGSCKFIIVGIYRPHSNSVDNFIPLLEAILNDPLLRARKVVVTGDFNINLIDLTIASTCSFMNILYANSFLPLITRATRFLSY